MQVGVPARQSRQPRQPLPDAVQVLGGHRAQRRALHAGQAWGLMTSQSDDRGGASRSRVSMSCCAEAPHAAVVVERPPPIGPRNSAQRPYTMHGTMLTAGQRSLAAQGRPLAAGRPRRCRLPNARVPTAVRCAKQQHDEEPSNLRKAAVLVAGLAVSAAQVGAPSSCTAASGPAAPPAHSSRLEPAKCKPASPSVTLQVLGTALPAGAEMGLYDRSKQLEAELQVLLRQRGVTLQELQSSPALAESQQQPAAPRVRRRGRFARGGAVRLLGVGRGCCGADSGEGEQSVTPCSSQRH